MPVTLKANRRIAIHILGENGGGERLNAGGS
jgi:hypothetical protein